MENLKDVCLTCFTTETNHENGYCINEHDNWFDNMDLTVFKWLRNAKIANHMTWEEIMTKIEEKSGLGLSEVINTEKG